MGLNGGSERLVLVLQPFDLRLKLVRKPLHLTSDTLIIFLTEFDLEPSVCDLRLLDPVLGGIGLFKRIEYQIKLGSKVPGIGWRQASQYRTGQQIIIKGWWFISLWFFIAEGYDMSMGATSAYIINVMMSAVYIVLIVKHPEIRRFSFTVAWTKGLGTALISVFMFIAPMTRYGAPDVPVDRTFLLVLCVITFVLDVIFVAGFWMRIHPIKGEAQTSTPVTA